MKLKISQSANTQFLHINWKSCLTSTKHYFPVNNFYVERGNPSMFYFKQKIKRLLDDLSADKSLSRSKNYREISSLGTFTTFTLLCEETHNPFIKGIGVHGPRVDIFLRCRRMGNFCRPNRLICFCMEVNFI